MRRILFGLLGLGAVLTLGACGGGSTASRPSNTPTSVTTTTATSTNSTTEAAPSTTDPVPTTADTPTYNLPPGYPKVEAASTLPEQVRNWMQMEGQTQAVQLAPGVWTPLPEGASIQDAIASGTADGFCASIKAYERQYLGGQQLTGSCW